MEPKLLEMLNALKDQVQKNADALARIDALEAAIKAGLADTVARAEIEKIKTIADEREKTIAELKRAARVSPMATDRIARREEALEVLGMIGRQILARKLGTEIPARFRDEAARLDQFLAARATLAEGSTPGSYFIPTILANEIIDTTEKVSAILGRVQMLTGMPTKMRIPTFTTRPTLRFSRASTDTAMTASDPSFSYLDIDTDEAYIYFPVDNWVLELGAAALGRFLLPMTRDAYMDGVAKIVIKGDGSATYGTMYGLAGEATYVTSMPNGKTAFADLDKSDLTAIKAAVLERGRVNGEWFMSEYVMGLIEDLDRLGKAKIIKDKDDGTRLVLGRPVMMDPDAPVQADSGAEKAVLSFGDLSAMMVVLAGNGIQLATSQEYLFGTAQTAFRALGHLDVVRKPVNVLRTLKTAAGA